MERHFLLILHLFAALSAFIHSVTPAAIPGFNECVFNERRYAIGEEFHPIVEIMGHEYEEVCYLCECQPTTIAQCEQIVCPATDCENPVRLGGKCCPVCLDPPDLTPGEPQACVYEGLRIPHDGVFHPPSMVEAYMNNNGSTAMDNPFCMECNCDNGKVDCEDVSSECQPLNCDETEAELLEGSCCLSCPSLPPEPPKGSCLDNILRGQYHEDGANWNPEYPGYGLVECIDCTCNNSETICVKQNFTCPEVPACTPENPPEPIVLCCPKCNPFPSQPVVPSSPPTTSNPSATNTPAPTNGNTTDDYKPPNISPVTDSDNTTDTDIDISPDLTPCRNRYTLRVWKHKFNDSMAIEDYELNTVFIYSWDDTEQGLERTQLQVPSYIFHDREQRMYENYIAIGWTIPRRVNGLSTRESKRRRIEMCTENCSTLVVNMLRPTDDFSCSDNGDK